MMPHRESPFDRALDRNLRILLSRRTKLPNPNLRPIASCRDHDTDLENLHEILGMDTPSGDAGAAEAYELQKMNDQHGNVIENKGSRWKKRMQSRNLAENTYTYALKAGMLLKTQMVVEKVEVRS